MIWEAFRQAIELILSLDQNVLLVLSRSLIVSVSALVIATAVGVPTGVWLAFARFPGRRIFTALINTGMGLPPVVVGLVVYITLSRQGPLGVLNWLFTMQAMITAQAIIATPIVAGITMSSVFAVGEGMRSQLVALGTTRWQRVLAILSEARVGVLIGIMAAFGRVIAEVGAVILVGGNIDGKTRVLTTAIVLETRRGNFDFALALGIVLIALAFAVNMVVLLVQGNLRAV